LDTRVVTTLLPTELAERLDDLAARLDRPKGWVVKEAIASYLALEDKRYRLTLEALADVNAGRALDHAEVEAWAARLAKPKSPRRRWPWRFAGRARLTLISSASTSCFSR